MTQATRVHSMPPLSTSVPERPPRLPTSQERAGELLMRWRLARAAGIPADRRLHAEESAMTADVPIYSAIEAHQKAYAGYDAAVAGNAPANENKAAFRALDRACRRLVKAETSTMAGLIACCAIWRRYSRRTMPRVASGNLPRQSLGSGLRHILHEVADRLAALERTA
jgi:hypothetical protein